MADNETWRVMVALTGSPDDPAPVYTDITQWVDTIASTVDVAEGDTTESEDDPSGATLVINNASQQFTLGNPLATMPLDAGMRVVIQQTIGYRTYRHISGYLRWPEIPDWAGGSTSAPRDGTITIQVIDLLGWLDAGEPFESMLAEHIKYTGGAALRYFWPLTDSGPAFATTVGVAATMTPQSASDAGASPGNSLGGQYVTPNGASSVLANDVTSVTFATDLNTISIAPAVLTSRWQNGYAGINMPVNSDEITLAFWFWPDDSRGEGAASGVPAEIIANNGNDAHIQLQGTLGASPIWRGSFLAGAGFLSLPCATPGMRMWNLIALTMNLATAAVAIYVHNIGTVTGVLAGAVTVTQVFDAVSIGGRANGSMYGVQVYVGAGAYTQAVHNAQIAMAQTGLEGQLTGQRVATIANYAGVPATARQIDAGVASMSRATLAGRTPTALFAEAAETEQGRLFANGAGNLTFQDRIRRYVP